MWKKPNRPNREITQAFNHGVVRFYTVDDVAEPGKAPRETLTYKCGRRYEERRVGIQRYFSSLQNQVRISRVIRCPAADISPQDAAITEDGRQYRIEMVQVVPDVFPECIDVTLIAVEQVYEALYDGG